MLPSHSLTLSIKSHGFLTEALIRDAAGITKITNETVQKKKDYPVLNKCFLPLTEQLE
jgi:hypothetical protein